VTQYPEGHCQLPAPDVPKNDEWRVLNNLFSIKENGHALPGQKPGNDEALQLFVDMN